MLRLFRLSGLPVVEVPSVSSYSDEWLISLPIDYGFDLELSQRRLTKFRLERRSGALLSFEMRGGLVAGIELLGIIPGRWDQVLEKFSTEVETTEEIPLHGIEVDGRNTVADCDLSAITQRGEFVVRWASSQNAIEVNFGVVHSSSKFGDVSVFFDDEQRLCGVRMHLDSPIVHE